MLGACGGLDRDIEDQITIEQGVYGLLVSGCDTSGCHDQPANGEQVMVFAPGEDHAVATVNAGTDGVYQIVLEDGDYTVCTYSCVSISVPAATLVRADWTSGPGGGQWHTP
jgi:hypothetical protein